jgi:GH35 family endo-1,4-beta-xylanase
VIATLVVGCVVGACVVVSASGATRSPAKASAPAGFYGVVPNSSLTKGDFKRMAKAGVGSIRLTMVWPSIQPTKGGPFDFTQTDQLVGLAAANNIKVLAMLQGTPSWESNGCTDKDCINHIKLNNGKEKAAWKAFVQAMVQRYAPGGTFWQGSTGTIPGGITDWQLWNEQNNLNEKNSAKTYVKLVKLSNRVIKSTDPTATIVTGGMFGEPPKGGKKSTAWGYLKQLYSNGIGGKIDAVALHPYSVKPGGIAPQIENIRKTLKAAHHSNVPTMVTEIGWGSSKKKHPQTGGRGRAFQVGPKKQKENLTASFKLLTSHRKTWNIGGVFWYGWKDPKNPPPGLCAFCYSSGLYKSNGTTPKPALGAYKAFAK